MTIRRGRTFYWFRGSNCGCGGCSDACEWRRFRRATDRTTSLAYVLCVICCLWIDISGETTIVSCHLTQDRSTSLPEFSAASVADFLAAAGSFHRCVQETGGAERESGCFLRKVSRKVFP